ncbi:MAG: 50S ribosomal protein L1 [Chloroflexota bacterium]
MAKHGRKYLAAAAKVERERLYEPLDALKLARETSITKFDATVEVHVRLGVDPKHADQQVRDTVLLPHGLGKRVRVLAFAEGEAARSALEAGADHIGDDEVIKRIQEGWLEFDATVATPEMMGKIGKSGLGRILGTRGLMPNPKAGTVVPASDLARAVKELKVGRVEFRIDRTANLHVPIGKASYEAEKLYDNMAALLEAVKKARPAGAKGTYIRKVVVTTTMGPGIRVDPNAAVSMETRL